jgi:hypothetical protein
MKNNKKITIFCEIAKNKIPIKQDFTLTFWCLEKDFYLSFINNSPIFDQPCKNSPGQDSKQDSQCRTSGTGHLGKDKWDMTARPVGLERST